MLAFHPLQHEHYQKQGGRTQATPASFTATCHQFGIDPRRWLRDTLTALPITPFDQLATRLLSPAC